MGSRPRTASRFTHLSPQGVKVVLGHGNALALGLPGGTRPPARPRLRTLPPAAAALPVPGRQRIEHVSQEHRLTRDGRIPAVQSGTRPRPCVLGENTEQAGGRGDRHRPSNLGEPETETGPEVVLDGSSVGGDYSEEPADSPIHSPRTRITSANGSDSSASFTWGLTPDASRFAIVSRI